MNEFISPNWHVILLHYPIALVTLGLLIELITMRRPGAFRTSGRCMILLGALLTIPTAASGIYAFRDAVIPRAMGFDHTWPWVAEHSIWTPDQWAFMQRHILYNLGGASLLILLACLYLAASDEGRRRIYWPCFAALICGEGLLAVGSWHGGEAVYRFGTAVGMNKMGSAEKITDFIPPIQLHVILAGFVIASVLVAISITVRRWSVVTTDVPESNPRDVGLSGATQIPPLAVAVVHNPIRPGRYWVLGTVVAICTAFFGVWTVAGEFSGQALRSAFHEVIEGGHQRLLVHAVCGVTIIILPLIVAGFVRYTPRHRAITAIPTTLLVLVAALQVWLGVAMLFDSNDGPLFGFNSSTVEPTTTPSPQIPDQHAQRDQR